MLTIKEASEKTGIKVRTLRSWVEKKKIRTKKDKKTGRVLIFEKDLDNVEGANMAVRNFYLKAEIDGYKTTLKGGPRNKNGGMELTVLQRDEGSKAVAFILNSYEKDGVLYTNVMDKDRKVITTFQTER